MDSDEDGKAPPKKKGAAGRIAERQAAEAAAKTPTLPEPRDPAIAFIEFTEPLGWPATEAENGAEKLLYAFKLADAKNKKDKAVLTVSFLPERKGKTTTVLRNWCEDFLLKGGGHPSVGELAKDEEIRGLKVTTIEVLGAIKQSKSGNIVPGQKLIGAVVQHEKGPFFIRALGPATLLDAHRDAIYKFIRSVRLATPKPPGAGQEGARQETPPSAGDARPDAGQPKPGAGDKDGVAPASSSTKPDKPAKRKPQP